MSNSGSARCARPESASDSAFRLLLVSHSGCDPCSRQAIVAHIGRQLDDSFNNDRRQFIRGSVLVLAVANRRNIIPNICQVKSFRVEVFFVTAIVLDVFAAVPACLDWCSHEIAIKHPRSFAFDVIQECIMTG